MKKSAVVASILLMISIGFVPIVLMSCSNEIPIYTVRFDSQGGNAIEPFEALKNSKLTEPSTPSKTGYEFGGWYKDSSYSERWVFSRDMVRSDMTLYAKWDAHTYAVTYNGNDQSTGTAPPTQTKKHGESLALSTNSGTLQRNGYRFGGWNTQSDGFGTNYAPGTLYETDTELTLYAKWIAEEYNVTLNKQGGNSGSDSITVTYDSAMPSATAPIKNGYLFDGYYDQVDGGAQYYSSTMVSSKVWDKDGSSDLYAKWTPAYTVSFNSQGGSSVPFLEGVRQGSRIGEPAAPTRNGYAFDGWFKDSSCVVAWDFDVETINSNTTLYAKWVVAYTVEFDSQGGSNIAALEGIRKGSKIIAPTAPTRNGYMFQGWYKDSDYTTEWDFSVDTVEKAIKLVAKWGVAIYTVSFNSQGGTEVTPITNILYGTKISEPVSPTRNRFVFGGWYRDSSYVQRYYFTTDVVTSSMILYAKWFLPHTVSFDSQGGSIVEDITDITHGDLIPEPLAPAKSGYAFDGWHKQSDCVEQWYFDADVITSDMTLYAKWIALHLVSFDSRGGSGVEAIEIGNGRKLVEPTAPTRPGYTFVGWYKEIACINRWNFSLDDVESTRTLYAKWTVQNYTITFNSDGGSTPDPANKVVTFVQEYGTLPISTRTGYVFDGWWTETDGLGTQIFEDTEVTITSNQTLYANWIPQYTITFSSQGGSTPSPSSKVVTFGQNYATLPISDRTGYVFDGWWTETNGSGTQIFEDAEVTITSNQTLYANWIGRKYTVTFDCQGGSDPSPASKSVTYAQQYGTLPTVSRENHVFAGWWTRVNGTGTQVQASTIVSISSDRTLYAKWIPQYIVTFDSRAGSTPDPVRKTVTYGQTHGTLPSVTRVGYVFEGWWTGENGAGGGISDSTDVSITSNLTLYANWLPITYTITYILNSGTNNVNNPSSYNIESNTIDLQYPTRDSYPFGGWYNAADFSGTPVTKIPQGSTGENTLYAKWLIPLHLTYVEGGTFQMGNTIEGEDKERPVHQVTLDSFYISTYEVTQDLYEQVIGYNPSFWKVANQPVSSVDWVDTVKFANALSRRDRLDEVYTIHGTTVSCDWDKIGYRLPTEAEWEYAARGGTQSKGYPYAGWDLAELVAWHTFFLISSPQAVGTMWANELGLYDMSGNVEEWCWDWYEEYTATAQTNPRGPTTGTYRVLRGGSFGSSAKNVRTTKRIYQPPSNTSGNNGFRLVLPVE